MRKILSGWGTRSPGMQPPRARRTRPSTLLGGLLGLCIVLTSGSVAAQTQTVSGTVVAAATQAPLSGAQVAIPATGQVTQTDAAGRFQFSGLSGQTVVLRITRIGYQSASRTARVGDADLRIALTEGVVSLDQLVVTGTAGGVQKRAVGNVVSQISAADVVKTAPVQSIQQLINGRAAGVVVLPATGMVGGGARIRIRGASSLSLSNEPLIYVDGIRVDNAPATGPTNQGFGSSVISRLNDIDPNSIESIEIIKGPAAATLYGTEAANGVIQIITKQGGQGKAVWNFSMKQGANWFANPEGRLYTNYGMNPRTGEIGTIDYSMLRQEYGKPIFRTGRLQDYSLSVGGGSPTVRYYIGSTFNRNQGIEPNNVARKFNGRANLTISPSSKMDIAANLGYITGRTDLSLEAGGGGTTWSTYYASPTKLDTPRKGFWSATPEAYYRAYNDYQNLGRFTGSVQVNHRPTNWFSQRLAIGLDQTALDNEEYVERMDDPNLAYFFSAGEQRGYKDVATQAISYGTLDYSGTASLDVSESLSSSTSVGAQFYRRYTKYVSAYGEDFPVPGLRAIAAAARQFGSEDYLENTTVGVFAQEQVGWNDRFFLTAALRADDNSAFGENFDLVYYPKASVSWVLSEEPFWSFGFVNTLKLRAAYGQSGQQPATFAALRTFAPVAGPNDQAAVTPQLLGNPDLGPEKSSELEMGFDAGFLQDRLGLEFTYYTGTTRDAILLRDIAPSSGFNGSQFVNAGEVSKNGVEVLLRGTPIRRSNLGWDLTLSLSRNDNKVEDLGGPEFISAGTYIQHRVGYPVGSWFGKKIVSAELDANGKPINAMCAGDVSGGGEPVACSSAPNVFLGRSIPKTEGAVSSTLTFARNFRLYGMVDFKRGQYKLDGNRRVRCWFFSLCEENYFPERFDPVVVAGSYTGYPSDLIKNASFAKLRELSLGYTIPQRWARVLGAGSASVNIAGRNLYTWTKYSGLEPEATFQGGSRGAQFGAWEQNVTPQLTQFVTTINLSF